MKYFLFLSSFLISSLSYSHPVIYKGGWVYWGQFTQNSNLQKISYTFHPRFSVEANTQYYSGLDEYRDYKVGLNVLVKRWYLENSQANLYTSLFAGLLTQNKKSESGVFQGEFNADWESQKLYTAAKVTFLRFQEKTIPKYSLRFGFAPYVGGMNDLQVWMIFQIHKFKEINDELKVTPMMRFFYKSALWEVGSNLKGSYFLTLMTHY